MDPLGALARTGKLAGGLDAAFAEAGALAKVLAGKYPAANLFRIDARAVHEAGGSEAQELAALIASAVDTLRRLAPHMDDCGCGGENPLLPRPRCQLRNWRCEASRRPPPLGARRRGA